MAEAIVALAVATPPEWKWSLAFSERGPLLRARHEILRRSCPPAKLVNEGCGEVAAAGCEFGACGALQDEMRLRSRVIAISAHDRKLTLTGLGVASVLG
ncbi:hypothetical protein [Bosea sp. FBZP-16]|uniref:hypothetical protein n=1 Tax=Bosea sp. FBZP-16 TaxID=2065382 RepID=UPI000C30CB22|nr:hypothetical protein [Bosea sp. FBZP-16]